MFGKHREIDNKEFYFANMAKRFALDAKMFRCRAAVHVENKDDITFWSGVLKHFRPSDRFHFIASSRNEFGNETSGVTQCLKYYHYLNPGFFICIDSDYRYLMNEKGINVRHFILQTYTYSFENHHCFADGLDDVCSRVTHIANDLFDFSRFLKEYSAIIYELFIWHLYFQGADPVIFSKYEFNQFINMTSFKPMPSVMDNAARALDELQERVEKRIGFLGRKYPNADLDTIKKKYATLGLTPETAYLFLRGHNLYDMISCICKEVCKALLKREKNGHYTREAVAALFKERSNVDVQLRQNIKYEAYFAIQKIEEDIRILLDGSGEYKQ